MREENHIVLLGSVRHLSVNDEAISGLRASLKPGTWIKIRDLVIAGPNFDRPSGIATPDIVGYISSSSYVVTILPYFRDVTVLAQAYLGRVRREMLSVTVPVHSSRPIERKTVSSVGVPYFSLATCLAKPTPSKLCCLANILSWYPEDVSRFAYTDPATNERKYLFSLLIGDDTARFDAILYGEDALFFLGGIHPRHFDEEAQVKVLKRLNEIVQKVITVEFFLRSYDTRSFLSQSSSEEIVPNIQQPESSVKRFRVFNTSLFEK
jgi:hypothetical protein